MAHKQGYNGRMDESLGMRNGRESSMKQSYKDRRNESYGMKNKYNDKYMSKGMYKDMRSADKKTYHVDVSTGTGWNEVKPYHEGYKGNPSQAFDYKY